MGQCISKRAVVSEIQQIKCQEQWEQRLLQSIVMGDLPRVRVMLQELRLSPSRLQNDNPENNDGYLRDINDPVTINAAAGRKVPLLHYACGAGQLEIAQYLVNFYQANVNAQDAAGWSPLHYACHRGRLDVARWLVLLAGAYVELRDANGETALHKLQSCGKIPAAEQPQQPQQQQEQHSSRDMFALLRLLIEDGAANPRVRNHDGNTLLDLLEKQRARSTAERVLNWVKQSNVKSLADSYADFAESDYELESNNQSSSSCAYTALSLSRYHVDSEEEVDELKHWYDIPSTTVASDSEEQEEDSRSDTMSNATPKEIKITLTDWINYLSPLTKQGISATLKPSLTPDTSLDEDDDFLHDIDNSFLLGGMIEI